MWVRHGGGPGAELVVRVGVAGDVPLGHAVGAHRPPLVVIAFEPDLEEVLELAILRDVARRELAAVLAVDPTDPRRAYAGFEQDGVGYDERHGDDRPLRRGAE